MLPWPRPTELDPDVTRVVVGDVHGDLLLETLLADIGVLDSQGRRNDGFYVVQLGDLVHLGHDAFHRDAHVIEIVLRGGVDRVLLGNHEAFHAYGMLCGQFSGMHGRLIPEVEHGLRRLKDSGHLHPAWEIDGWLITHAGVHPSYASQLPRCARDAAHAINRCFFGYLQEGRRPSLPLFEAVGPVRGNEDRPGGLLWADDQEIIRHAGTLRWPQIIGHSPQPYGIEANQPAPDLWICDAGAALSGRLAALVKPGAAAGWQPHIISA